MPTLFLTRRFAFSAAHRLHSPVLSAGENTSAYGMCENVHGHNYHLIVTVRGAADVRTGFFCNVLDLAGLVQRLVCDPSEHRFLNDVALFAGMVPTMENLATRVWQAIEAPLRAQGMVLSEVRLGETEDHWVTIRE